MKIAVVIPTYNERQNIEKLIDRIFDLEIPDLEIVIVDDNSPDGTGKLVYQLAKKNKKLHLIHRERKLGLGTAYIKGFQHALASGAEYIFEMDADFSHNPKTIKRFLAAADRYDLVIGSRYKGGIRIINWPLRRLALSLLATRYARLVTGLALTDITSGFKCYRRKVLQTISLDKVFSNGYSFQIEMKYRAQKKGFSLYEIPIIFIDRHSGTSKISRKIIFEAILIVWRLRFGLYVK